MARKKIATKALNDIFELHSINVVEVIDNGIVPHLDTYWISFHVDRSEILKSKFVYRLNKMCIDLSKKLNRQRFTFYISHDRNISMSLINLEFCQ